MKPEDIDLADENAPRLNADFYRSEPHKYFLHRLSNLMLVAGKDEELARLINEGLSFGLVSIGKREPEPYKDTDRESALQFVALEAEVLLHHATETLLRLFLAHSGAPPSPWLVLSRLRNFREFKKQIEKRFLTDEPGDRRSDIAEVFYGTHEPSDYAPPPSEADWAETIQSIDRFLVGFSATLLGNAHLYNAAKHGLAVKPGEHGLTLGDKEDPIIQRHGMALHYLEVVDSKWRRKIEWVETGTSVVRILVAAQLMEQMWTVGRRRYTETEDETDVRIWKDAVHTVINNGALKEMGVGKGALKSMSESLLYYAHHEEE